MVSPVVRTPSHGATAYKSHTKAPWGSQTTRRHPAAFHHLPQDEGREKEEERREGGRRRGIGARRDDPSEPLIVGRSSALNREHARSATTRLQHCLHRARPAPRDLAVKPATPGASSSRATTGTPRPRSHGSASSPGIDTTSSCHPPHLHHGLHKQTVSLP